MNRLLPILGLLWVLLLGAGGSVAHAEGRSAGSSPGPVITVRRFALVVGANDGGDDRVVLRFANTDAQAVSSVLRNLGGVGSGDLESLYDPSPEQLMEAIDRMSKRIREARSGGQHVQFVFYYSGHSDEQGLLLSGELVGYKELRKRVQAVPADVRIAVLDSCASGAFTRTKGGTKRAPFLVSPAAEVKGHAFLTSSSMDEAAQESDRVGGSFFTHYFTTGLRGAADVDGDRLITLSEAYQFAFDETLARTEATRGGAQHAAYDIQLAGSGDLVMTDLRETSARLEISEVVGGRIAVRNGAGTLAAELYKPPGSAPVGLALEPGRYQITVDDGQHLWRADLEVRKGGRTILERDSLVRVERESTVQRGDAPDEETAEESDSDYTRIHFNFGLLPPLSVNGQDKSGKKIINTGSIAFLWSRSARVDGVALAFGGSKVDESLHGAQLSMGANIAGEAHGVQLANGFNHAGKASGMQAAIVNHAGEFESGFQAGLVNVAGSMRGAQLSLINVGTDVKGAQIGLFNFAGDADAQLGLLSITREGNVHPEVSISDTAAINVGLRFPARHTYSLLDFGIHPGGSGAGWQVGLGFGGRVQLPAKLFLDLDGVGYAWFRGLESAQSPDALAKLRLMIGWQPLERVSIFAGPTANLLVEGRTPSTVVDGQTVFPRESRPGLYQWTALDYRNDRERVRVRLWPGFVAGVRF